MAIKRNQPVEKKNNAATMVGIKRKSDIKTKVEKKRITTMSSCVKRRKLNQQHVEEHATTKVLDDRISDLPESLRFHILSFLEAKQAVRTCVLSKQWVASWKSVPVFSFTFNQGYIRSYDNLVNKALSKRDRAVKLERLVFNRGGACSKKILKTVFDYSFNHGVKELEIHIKGMVRNKNVWPIGLRDNSLKSLKLQSSELVDCLFLGLKSESFKNLRVLHLRRAIINHADSFSGFPMLEKLTLVDFHLNPELDKTLNVHALRLSELTISCHTVINHCVLTTPELKFFEYEGFNFPVLKTHQGGGFPVLDTLVVDFQGGCYSYQLNELFTDLMKFFGVVYNAKSLKVCSAVTELLSMFHEELANRCSPFLTLRGLTLDFTHFYNQNLFDSKCPSFELFEARVMPNVKDYLLKNSPEAKFSLIHPKRLT